MKNRRLDLRPAPIGALAFFLLAFLAGSDVRAQSSDTDRIAKAAVAAHSTGNLLLEQILLRRIVMQSTGDLADAALHRLAENALERGDYAETIRLLHSGNGTADPNSPQVRRDLALMGEAYRRSGDAATATQLLTSVLWTMPNLAQPDDAALMAVKSLDAIGGDVDEAEHFRRAGVYQFNRYWAEARAHYEKVTTTADQAEGIFQIGRGYAQDGNFAAAIPYFQRVIDAFDGTQPARDSLLQVASANSRIGNNDEALRRYQSFIDKYPADDKLDRAYLNILDIYRDIGDVAHALEWCQKTEAAFPGKTPEALAIFDEAKIYASRNEWQNEIAALDRLKGRNDLGGATQPGGTTTDEVGFMRAYALEQAGAKEDAIRAYSSIAGEGFYGEWATRRSWRLDGGVDPVHRELQPLEPPPPLYADIISRRANARDLDPALIVHLMRQESKFDPQARSAAAARGLMQFTHPQALKIARELGWTYFSDDELYSPEVSIALAAQYIADLDAMFPNQPEAVIASYNGGEDNVKRWMARARSDDPERYVPEIVYGQTKDYVQKVMANYRVYQQLDDAKVPSR